MKTLQLALVAVLLTAGSARGAEDIRANGLLVEEAYNQEAGSLHHISRFQLSLEEGGGFEFSFAEELPLFSQLQELGVLIPLVNVGTGLPVGLGDVRLGYRLQAIGGDRRTELAFAPRVSIIFPTGDAAKGHGFGGFGAELSLPISLAVRSWLSSHTNLGVSGIPLPNRLPDEVEPEGGEEAYVVARAAQSFIWLPHTHVNLLVDVVWQGLGLAEQPVYTLAVSPGLRGKLDFDNSLQMVLGLGVPLGVGPGNRDQVGMIFYLAFEHDVPILGGGQEDLLSADRL